jgi:hypothetical protein
VFLNEEASRQFYLDWEKGADDIVAAMRSYAGQRPHDKPLTDNRPAPEHRGMIWWCGTGMSSRSPLWP